MPTRLFKYLPLLVAFLGFTLTLLVWHEFSISEQKTAARIIQNDAASLKNSIEIQTKNHVRALERMAQRWAISGGTSREQWVADATRYVTDFNGYQAVEWVDQEGFIRWVMPKEGNEKAIDFDLKSEVKRKTALEKARDERITTLGSTVDLVQGEKGFLVFAPIHKAENFGGFITGIFRVNNFVASSLSPQTTENYSVELFDDGQPIFQSSPPNAEGNEFAAEDTVNLYGVSWNLKLTPNSQMLAALDSGADEWALIIGMLLSFLFAWIVWLVAQARHRAVQADTAKIGLEKEAREREQIQKTLQETSTLQKAVLNGANYMIIAADTQGTIISFNKAAGKNLGYRAEELIGKATPAVFHDGAEIVERAKELSDEIGQTIEPGFEVFVHNSRTQEVEEREWTYVRKDGSRFPVSLSITALRDESGNITGFLGVASDITERKQASERLFAAEERFKAFMNNSPAVSYIKDRERKYVFMNQTMERVFNVNVEKMNGMTDFDWLPEEIANTIRQRDREVLATGKAMEFTQVIPATDGFARTWQTYKFPIYDKTGTPFIGVVAFDITQQQEFAQALRKSEQYNRDLIEKSPGLISTHTLDGVLLSVNAAAAHALGYKPEELIGKSLVEFIPPDRQALFGEFLRQLRENNGLKGTMRVINKQGEERTWSYTNTVYEKDGTPYVLGHAFDITESYRAEIALRKSEEYNRTLIEKSPGLICTHTLDGTLTMVNPAAAHTLGYEPEEMIGKSLKDFISPDVQIFFAVYLKAIKNKKNYSGSMRIVARSGEERVWSFTNTLYEKDGVPYVLGFAFDTTESRRAEIALRQSEERLRLFVENTPAAVAMLDCEMRYVMASKRWLADYNLGEQDIIGRSHYEVFPDIPQSWKDIHQRGIKGEIMKCDEDPFPREDGSMEWLRWEMYPWHDNRGEIGGIIFFTEVITERKRMEEEIREARDAALESARLKSEFLANMSHEIRTPMNGVIGMTDILLSSDLNEEQREHAEIIKNSADGLLNIINDILDFSKIEAGKLNFETIDFDLQQTVESTIEFFAEQSQRKRIEIASYIEPDVCTSLRGDPGRLKQVLTNLIGNAVKFTSEGEVIVRVFKQSDSNLNCKLRFEISDSGIGIKPEQQKYLFQAFTQADGSMTRKFGGTGLGLAISKQIVEMMDGEIGVESEIGKGSTFSFSATFEKQLANEKPKSSKRRADLSNLRVLIVDDNKTNRQILTRQLSLWGMTAEEADGAPAALEKLRQAAEQNNQFDLAILDLVMPETNGFELAYLIKSNNDIANIKLILMPSFGQRGHAATAHENGIDGYLIKPVRQSDLYDCIATLLAETEKDETQTPDQSVSSSELLTKHSLQENRHSVKQELILVAEDNLVNQKVTGMQLEKLGYQTEIVSNGLEALQAVKTGKYSAVLMDCQMPEMDGYTAATEIRRYEAENNQHPRVPIIAMTANAMQGEREKCMSVGMDDYISKPVKIDALAKILRKQIKSVEANRNSSSSISPSLSKTEFDISEIDRVESLESAVLDSFRELQIPGSDDLVTDLINLFIEDSEKRIEILKQAAAERDFKTVKEQAHTFKGSAGNIGARRMAMLGKKIEENISDIEFTNKLIKLISNEFKNVRSILSEMKTVSTV